MGTVMNAGIRSPGAVAGRSRQRGAVLYVALIMLILLALLGLVGMRVAGLQERMSANYRDVNQAFQAAEQGARETEKAIRDTLVESGTFIANSEDCLDRYDPGKWASSADTNQDTAEFVKRIDRCAGMSALDSGAKVSEDTGNIYQISSLRSNGRGASAVIDTVYIPQ